MLIGEVINSHYFIIHSRNKDFQQNLDGYISGKRSAQAQSI